jgi:hypothetical protein
MKIFWQVGTPIDEPGEKKWPQKERPGEKRWPPCEKEMDANQAKADAEWRAWRKRMDTSHKEIMAVIKPGRNMETIACQEMEAHPEVEKPASVDMKPEAAGQEEEVPVEDATVIPVVGTEEETMSITRKETMACQEMETRLEEEEANLSGQET